MYTPASGHVHHTSCQRTKKSGDIKIPSFLAAISLQPHRLCVSLCRRISSPCATKKSYSPGSTFRALTRRLKTSEPICCILGPRHSVLDMVLARLPLSSSSQRLQAPSNPLQTSDISCLSSPIQKRTRNSPLVHSRASLSLRHNRKLPALARSQHSCLSTALPSYLCSRPEAVQSWTDSGSLYCTRWRRKKRGSGRCKSIKRVSLLGFSIPICTAVTHHTCPWFGLLTDYRAFLGGMAPASTSPTKKISPSTPLNLRDVRSPGWLSRRRCSKSD